jgi:uncharacterized protein YjbI with pentapeptide repeats
MARRGVNLRSMNLSGMNLRDDDMNLTYADLTGAILTGMDLTGIDLTGAILTNADLTGAILTGTILTGANLTGVIGANLTGAIIDENVPQAVAPQAVAPQGFANQHISAQVHNSFNNLNIERFMEIIRDNITPIYIEGELLEKLITYSETNLPEKKEELIRINATIDTYSNINNDDVQDVITFVLLQPDPFIQLYITNFTEDCLNAFDDGRVSCVKGQYERVFMNLEGVIGLTCNEGETGCPPVYRELLACFKPDYNKLFRDWFVVGQHEDAETNYENKSPEEKEAYINAKKAEFKAYVFGHIGERHDIDEYIAANFSQRYSSTYEGGRKQKTNKRKTNKRKTNKRKTNKRKTNKRKTNKRKTNKRKTNKRKG